MEWFVDTIASRKVQKRGYKHTNILLGETKLQDCLWYICFNEVDFIRPNLR